MQRLTFRCFRCLFAVVSGSLAGRTAIVTGSTSGIGLGIARSFLGAGANVMLNGFGDASAISSLQSQLKQEFPSSSIAYSPADMSSAEQIHTMVKDTVEKLGSVDILVNKSVEGEHRGALAAARRALTASAYPS